jgi:hypothetical protein
MSLLASEYVASISCHALPESLEAAPATAAALPRVERFGFFTAPVTL